MTDAMQNAVEAANRRFKAGNRGNLEVTKYELGPRQVHCHICRTGIGSLIRDRSTDERRYKHRDCKPKAEAEAEPKRSRRKKVADAAPV